MSLTEEKLPPKCLLLQDMLKSLWGLLQTKHLNALIASISSLTFPLASSASTWLKLPSLMSSNISKWPNQIREPFLIPYSFWPLQHLALLTTCFLLICFSALDIQNSVSTHITTSYLLFLSFLTKQHLFLPSPKCGYVPRLELWFLVLLFDSNNNEGMNHSHIPYTQPEKTNNIMSRATKENKSRMDHQEISKTGGQGWANGERET